MRSAKGTGSDPGNTACEAAGDVDAWPRLRPHPGLPSLGAPLHLLAQALEWTQLFVPEPRIGPVGAGPSAYPGRVAYGVTVVPALSHPQLTGRITSPVDN